MTDLDDVLDEIMFSRLSGAKLPEMAPEDYRQWMLDIPGPTDSQIQAFADYVAGARSWYKHLPLMPPGERFHFYIDPYVGADRVVTVSGEVHLFARTEDSEPFHYSWMTTADYREQFGCLAFSCAKGSTLFGDGYLGDAPVLIDHNRLYPELVVSSAMRMAPPNEVLEAGSCSLTALVHPHATADYVASRLAMKHRERTEHSDAVAEYWAEILNFWCDRQDQASDLDALAESVGTDPEFVALVEREKTRLRQDMVDAIQCMCHMAISK